MRALSQAIFFIQRRYVTTKCHFSHCKITLQNCGFPTKCRYPHILLSAIQPSVYGILRTIHCSSPSLTVLETLDFLDILQGSESYHHLSNDQIPLSLVTKSSFPELSQIPFPGHCIMTLLLHSSSPNSSDAQL